MNNTAEQTQTTISASDVAEFLSTNTDFFQQYPELLHSLNTTLKSDGSISLVERQLKGLRNKVSESEQELTDVINHARENQLLLEQTIELALALIPSKDLPELDEILTNQLSNLFSVSYCSLLLNNLSFSDTSCKTFSLEEIQDALSDNFPNKKPVCGRLRSSDKKILFTESDDVQSVAILPLGNSCEYGILALGSENPSHFDPEMGDMFLVVISKLLTTMLKSRFS